MKGHLNIIIDRLVKRIFFLIALSCLAILLLIVFFLFKEGLPIFQKVSVAEFLFGGSWYPTSDHARFGTLPLISASVAITLLSALISVPVSLAIAIYLSELAKPAVREIVKPLIEIIASIPSVIIGFFGMVVVGPFLQNYFNLDSGWNLLNASLMLSFMSIPTIASISEDAISSVPRAMKEASYALGANRWQTIFHVTLPYSLSGIWTAVILGISRVIGETMVVLMVAGGAAVMPGSIFEAVRPLTSSIAAEMGEAPVGSDHYHALFAIGIILFFITLGFNLIAGYFSNRYKFERS